MALPSPSDIAGGILNIFPGGGLLTPIIGGYINGASGEPGTPQNPNQQPGDVPAIVREIYPSITKEQWNAKSDAEKRKILADAAKVKAGQASANEQTPAGDQLIPSISNPLLGATDWKTFARNLGVVSAGVIFIVVAIVLVTVLTMKKMPTRVINIEGAP